MDYWSAWAARGQGSQGGHERKFNYLCYSNNTPFIHYSINPMTIFTQEFNERKVRNKFFQLDYE